MIRYFHGQACSESAAHFCTHRRNTGLGTSRSREAYASVTSRSRSLTAATLNSRVNLRRFMPRFQFDSYT
jgi:hypothetical protein